MNAIINSEVPSTTLYVPEAIKDLIKASLAENTLKAYQRALAKLTDWLSGRTLSDALLASYITTLHRNRQIPSNHRTGPCRSEVAAQTSITGIYQLPHHADNIGRHP